MADQKLHACANFPIQARLSFARRTREFFVTNDEKYQTCLIFGLHVTNDENAVNIARTRGLRRVIQMHAEVRLPFFDTPCRVSQKTQKLLKSLIVKIECLPKS